jgi:hypothetical protein
MQCKRFDLQEIDNKSGTRSGQIFGSKVLNPYGKDKNMAIMSLWFAIKEKK